VAHGPTKALPSGSSISVTGNSGTDLWVRESSSELKYTKLIHIPMQAPDVHKVGSLYYMYYAVSSFGSQDSAIGLATSATMELGSWTDLGATGVSSTSAKPYNAIDPDSGWQYLLFELRLILG
jgi:arabinan endo-1,5-alpha-L-arabinosidase